MTSSPCTEMGLVDLVIGRQRVHDGGMQRGSESVKRSETLSIHKLCATSSRTGGLIHATSGIFGAVGGRCRNRVGLAA